MMSNCSGASCGGKLNIPRNGDLKLPIKVVVNRFIKEPMLMINPEHHAKLIEISTRVEYEADMWKFRRILEGMVGEAS